MLQVQSENPMVERGSVRTTHFKFGLMVVTWSIPSGLPGSRIIRTISQSARKWRLMAETGTTQFAQWNDLLFVRKKTRWGKRISTLPPSQNPPSISYKQLCLARSLRSWRKMVQNLAFAKYRLNSVNSSLCLSQRV